MTMRVLLSVLCLCASAVSCSSSPDVEPLFTSLETGTAAEAMAAGEKLVEVYEDANLPRLEKALDAAPVRTLQLIGDLGSDGSAKLLLDRLSYLLESKDR